MISLSEVTMGFGTQVLFENASWQLAPQGHYGLVGANGTGKSTLLRLLSGELRPESGTVSIPNDLAIGTLGQDHFSYDEETLLDTVIRGRPRLWEALREKHRLLEEEATGEAAEEQRGQRLAELETVIADTHGYEAETTAGILLEGLGLPQERHTRLMKELSGGYRLRVLLAQTLFMEPALLLLDEPTNHLDIVSIRWLEEYLRSFSGAFVVVSHDRHFLNAVCGQIVDVDYHQLKIYKGNYDKFEAAKALAAEQKEVEIARAEEKIADMEKFITRFKAKATKARQAQSRKKQVERMEADLPEIRRSSRRFPSFGFEPRRHSGREVLRVKDLRKSYDGRAVLDGIGFTVERGEKVALVGPNGVGKSTLLKIIMERVRPDGGQAGLGYEVHPGYFAQDHREILGNSGDVYSWLHSRAPAETIGTIRGMLGRVLFSGDDAEKKVSALSGGEAARLLLAALMVEKPNLLILDEPTNHLDLEGREALMKALSEYEGTLLFVSHDRHFVSSVARRVLVLNGQEVEDHHGNYEDYLAAQGADYLDAETARQTGGNGRSETSGDRTSGAAASGGQAYRDRKENRKALEKLKKNVRRLEREVEQLEQDLQQAETRFADDDYYKETPWEQVQSEQEEQRKKKKLLERTVTEWESAASELEKMRGTAAEQ
ncbi:MAG: ATP-binding cassette domain-containing protein [Deltaproteobacteria bacterium]|nr:ATP-binding cassette domain-containing protein [Deltaproteobacteria bacterium]